MLVGKCTSGAACKSSKVYGFCKVDFVLALLAAVRRMQKFCVKIWLRNSIGLWRKWGLYFDIGHTLYLKFGISKLNRTCGAFPVANSFVACEEQIIMLKTGSKFVQNGGNITN